MDKIYWLKAEYKYGGEGYRFPNPEHYKSISTLFHYRFIAEMQYSKGFEGKIKWTPPVRRGSLLRVRTVFCAGDGLLPERFVGKCRGPKPFLYY